MQDAVNITSLGGSEGHGLRLTFLSPRLGDSGRYVCSASNQFESVNGFVDLAVYWPGKCI